MDLKNCTDEELISEIKSRGYKVAGVTIKRLSAMNKAALELHDAEYTTSDEWCNNHNCFCSDAKEITNGEGNCDYNCKTCDKKEIVSPKGKISDTYMERIIKKYGRK